MLFAAGCSQHRNAEPKANTSPNSAILDEVDQAKSWFHAKKVRPIWAKRLEKDETVQTIEGIENVRAGAYLCRGEAGDLWPQTEKNFLDRYEKTSDTDAEGWSKYLPRPDNQGVMAAQVNHPFTVHGKWAVLSGKAGDYIVKNYADRDMPNPDDVWIVDQRLFHSTYEAVK